MMRGCLSSLTAAMLALHTLLGCCWHHAHCCTQECGSAVCIESPSPDGCQGDRADDSCAATSSVGHGHHGHHGRHECQGGTCTFMGPNRVNWQQSSLSFDALPAVLSPINGAAVAEVRAKPFFGPDAFLPPLRRHLLDQVLLI
jgi:hypothetical protein